MAYRNGSLEMSDDALLKAATNAAAMLGAIYEWLDRVEKAGGTTSIQGVASCHAMLKSLRSNEKRARDLVMRPLAELLEARK